MNTEKAVRALYPKFPDILDEETLASVATMESAERAVALRSGWPRTQYLRGLLLKAVQHLGHSHFTVGELPRSMRLSIAEQLGLPAELARIRISKQWERRRLLGEVRHFLGLSSPSAAIRRQAEHTLSAGLAVEDGDMLELVAKLIEWFRNGEFELPPLGHLSSMAARARRVADRNLYARIAGLLSPSEKEKLDSLLGGKDGKTPLDALKRPVGKKIGSTLLGELERLRQLESYPSGERLAGVAGRRKVEQYAELARRYYSTELRDLSGPIRYSTLLCYLRVRRGELLDALVQLLTCVWRDVVRAAKTFADEEREKRHELMDEFQLVLRDLLGIICTRETPRELVRDIRRYRTPEQYEDIKEKVEKTIPWTTSYYKKLKNHTMARFVGSCRFGTKPFT